MIAIHQTVYVNSNGSIQKSLNISGNHVIAPMRCPERDGTCSIFCGKCHPMEDKLLLNCGASAVSYAMKWHNISAEEDNICFE